MKTIEKLERAKWLLKEDAGRNYLFIRGDETLLYDFDNDKVVAWSNGVVSKKPDELDLDIIFAKV
jgi:hypothetical protein